MADLTTNINQAISDFTAIKQALIDKGVEVPDGTKTSEYGNLIGNISGGTEKIGYIQNNLFYETDQSSTLFNEYVISEFTKTLNVDGELTFEVHFQYSSFVDGSNKGRIVLIYYNSNCLFGISMNNESAEFFIQHYDLNTWNILESDSNISIPVNEKHTISCVVSDDIKLYKDGQLYSTFSKNTTIGQGNNTMQIIYKTDPTRVDRYVTGKVYSVRIYEKALTEEELIFNYNTDVQNYN